MTTPGIFTSVLWLIRRVLSLFPHIFNLITLSNNVLISELLALGFLILILKIEPILEKIVLAFFWLMEKFE